MTLNEFIVKWQGKYCEVAGSPGAVNQCVDLANAYIRDVLLQPIIEWTNAVDFPSKAGDKYEYILNTPTNIPKEGDIMIWKPSPGHIAMFIEGNVDTFRSFDQNFPTGSFCHVQNHTYQNVTGWLRLKVAPPANPNADLQKQLDDTRKERDRNWTWFTGLCDVMKVAAVFETAKSELEKLVGIEDKYNQVAGKLSEAQKQVGDLQGKLTTITDSYDALQSQHNALQGQLNAGQATIQSLKDNLAALEKQIMAPVRRGWRAALVALIDKF